MSLDRDKFANTLSQIALPALAGAAGSGALSAYMSSQSEHPGESPVQRRRRVLRNAMVSAGLGGMAGAALPTGLKMLTEPYVGSGVMGGPNLWDKGTDLALGHAALLGAGGAGLYGIDRRVKDTKKESLENIFQRLGPKSPLPKDLAETVGFSELNDKPRLSHLFGAGDSATKFILNRLSSGAPDAEGLNRLFQSADLMRSAGHPGISISDLQRMYKPMAGTMPLEDFPASFHRNPAEVDWHKAYSDYLRTSNNPLDKLLGAVSKHTAAPGLEPGNRSVLAKLAPVAEWLAGKSRPGTAQVLKNLERGTARWAGPFGKVLLGVGGISGVLAANKLQQKIMGN